MNASRKSRLLILISAYALVALAAGAAALADNHGPEEAYAWHRCTRYVPGYSIDVWCDEDGAVDGNVNHLTTGIAPRNQNHISIAFDQWIYVWYGYFEPAWAYGTWLAQGSSDGSQNAGCRVEFTGAILGHCTTFWHS